MHQKTLGGRAKPGPTEGARCFSRAPNLNWRSGNGALVSRNYGCCVVGTGREEQSKVFGEELEGRTGGALGTMYSNPSLPDT
jgi:hypothetical protein